MEENIIREGSWLCPYCSAKNKGAKMKCQACGQTRGEVEFFYEEEGEVLADAGPGPDWVCGFCDTSNTADLTNCRQCGAAHGDGRDRQVTDVAVAGSSGSGTTGGGQRGGKLPDRVKPAQQPSSGIAKYVIITILLVMGGMIWLGSRTWEAAVVVTGQTWSTEVAVEEFKPVQKEAWKNEVPASATIISESREIRSYQKVRIGTIVVDEPYSEKVQDGTRRVKTGVKNLGNGKFQEIWKDEPVYKTVQKTRRVERPKYREDPIYDMKVKYEINEWAKVSSKRLHGTDGNPQWPVVEANITTPPAVGNTRPGARVGEFSVQVKDEKENKDRSITSINEKPLTEEVFRTMIIGSKWKLTLDINDDVVKAEIVK